MPCYLVEVHRDWNGKELTDLYGVVANDLARVEVLMERAFEVNVRRGVVAKVTRIAEDVIVDSQIVEQVSEWVPTGATA